MSVQSFVSRFEELNSLLMYCLNINNVNPVPLDDAKKCIVLKKACPGAWTDKITKANLSFTDFQDLTTYYTGLKSVKTSSTRKRNSNYSSNNNSNNNGGNDRSRYCNNNNNNQGKNCNNNNYVTNNRGSNSTSSQSITSSCA
eukprot:400771-Ditylum_brightwellii.AAC.1